MVLAASLALADSLTVEEKDDGLVYPRLTRIREISVGIAVGVIKTAQKEGVDTNNQLRGLDDAALAEFVEARMWRP
jgi:malate dehydrogenase (oxaloacetate-decarboxylating)(NADP+)